MIFRVLAIASLLVYCGTAEPYGSLRCKGKIINVGMDMNKVLSLCGEPSSRLVEHTPVRHRNAKGFSSFAGISQTELWAYDRGWGKFPVTLRFQDETLRHVVYGEHRSGAGRQD